MKNAEKLTSLIKQKVHARKSSILIAFVLIMLSGGTVLARSSSEEGNKVTQNGYVFDKSTSLWKYIESLPVIDTHEHISSEAELLGIQIIKKMKPIKKN